MNCRDKHKIKRFNKYYELIFYVSYFICVSNLHNNFRGKIVHTREATKYDKVDKMCIRDRNHTGKNNNRCTTSTDDRRITRTEPT